MKKFRFIAVLALAISMLFVVASATVSDFEEVKYDGSADTLTVVLNVAESTNVDMYASMNVKFDETVLAIDAEACTSDYTMTFYDYTVDYGYGLVALSNEAGDINLEKGAKLATLVFNVLDKEAVVGTVIEWDAEQYAYNKGAVLDFSGSVTVTAAAAPEPETPVSVSTTMTVNEKEYTDVPNAVVSGTIDNGAFNGSIVVDYWKDGVKALAPKVFSTFAGMPTFSGSGSATFKVAIMGVPSNVTITSITVQ